MSTDYPNIRPSLLLDFANTKKLDPRITFTRTTTATYYDGVTTAKAEENLFQYSQEFDNAYWTKTNTTITANDTAAPDGTTTADKAEQTSTSNPYIRKEMTVSGQYQFSVFVKYIDIQWFRLLIGSFSVWFDVQNGVVGTAESGRTGTIQASTNGFYRLIVDATGLSGSTFFYVIGADGDASIAEALGSYYLWGAQLEQRSSVTSYTATTTQPITNYIPVLLTAASGVARFQHNPTTDESLGLLIEEARTNLLTYSADFSNAAWVKSRASITSNTIVAPDGTLTGDKLVEDTTATNTHYIVQTYSYTSGTAYNYSFYAKAAERTRVAILAFPTNSVFTSSTAIFNLSTGLITRQDAGFTSASITNVGNGWYRCSIAITAAATATGSIGILLADGDTSVTYTGNGYSGAYIWGAQLEAGAFPTSYIATTSATVTRNADAANMTGSNFTSWYNQAEGTLYAEGSTFENASASRTFIQIDDTTTSNRIMINRAISSSIAIFTVTVAGVSQADIANGSAIADGSNAKMVGAYQVNNFAFSSNANSASTDTSGTIPVVSQMLIGSRTGATNFLNGRIKKIAYYPLRVTNAQLQALTS